jgi:ABC-type glycerol-3-phosphate transport system substrate-binding protein
MSLSGISSAGASSTVTLNWITFDSKSGLTPIVQGFEKIHPNIHINIDSYPLSSFTAKVVADMTAKTSSVDIITVDAPEVAEYTTRHYVLPLNKYFTNAELDKIAAPVRASSYYRGVLSAPAEVSSSHVLYYNTKLFAAHHITPPSSTNPWTWQHVAKVARELTVRSGGETKVWGLVFEQGTAPYEMLPLPQGLGANPLNFLSKGWLQAMQFYYDLFNVWKVSSNVGPATQTGESDSLFETGHIAMLAGGEWDAVTFSADHTSYGYALYPKWANGKWVVPTDGAHLGVAAYSKHIPQDVAFIKYATIGAGPTIAFNDASFLNMPSAIPTINEIRTQAKFSKPPWSVYRLAIKEIPYNVPRPTTPFFDAWSTIFDTLFGDVATGTKPATALQSAERQWKTVTASG